MAKSKTNKDRKQKLQNFKQKSKKMNEQQKQPKQQLFPIPEWQSNETLDLNGGLLQALDNTLNETYQHINAAINSFQKISSIMQSVVAQNINSGKVKITYDWNNGEKATEEEVVEFKKRMEEVKAAQIAQQDELKKQANAEVTGLVGLTGEPIGTTQELTSEEVGVTNGPGNDFVSAETIIMDVSETPALSE